MKTLKVELGERSYPIHIGAGLLGRADLLAPHLSGRRVAIVTNDRVAPLYLEAAKALVARPTIDIVLPDGEEHKNLAVLGQIFDKLLQARCDRQAVLLALGGGVIGDITGFAAACYQRGVSFVQMPTTLLAQVDSSVGGKTGINHPLGKNMIGAFHQPRAVLIDTDTLSTLPDRELRAGLAEVIKYGLIRDPDFLGWLEQNLERILRRDAESLVHAIERSCRNKAEVVALDERESGVRAILNLGHTFGHAVETGLGYGEWLHGEAVAAGMVAAADLSHRLGWLTAGELQRIESLIARAGLPTGLPRPVSPARMRELMSIDKKVADGQLRLVLIKGIGQAVVSAAIPSDLLDQTLISRQADH